MVTMTTSRTSDEDVGIGGIVVTEDTSIEEIFSQLSIQQIQKLNKEYKQNVTDAKDELHGLVGSKYRDIIEIADDINCMHEASSGIEHKLSELSYRKSGFVNFNTNPITRLNSQFRQWELENARDTEKIKIITNILNDKLEAFVLRLDFDHKGASDKRDYDCVFYSKCFHIVEKVFGRVIGEIPFLKSKFDTLKAKFTAYLENQMAIYNCACYKTNLDFTEKKRSFIKLTANVITSKGSKHFYLPDDDWNRLGYYEDEIGDLLSTDDESTDPYYQFFRPNVSPIILYLVSYIFLNGSEKNINNIKKASELLFRIRYEYLKIVLEETICAVDSSTVDNISFLHIFQYIENTLSYMTDYVTDKQNDNSLTLCLKYFSKIWNSTKVLNYEGWILDQEVVYDLSSFQVIESESATSNEESISQLLRHFFNQLISISSNPESSKKEENVLGLITLYYNFVTCLIKIESFSQNNDSSSKLVKILTLKPNGASSVLTDLFKSVTNNINSVLVEHFKAFISELPKDGPCLASVIKTAFTNNLFDNEEVPSAFTKATAQLMESDLDAYLETVIRSSSLPSLSSSSQDICFRIDSWFEKLHAYNMLFVVDTDVNEHELSPNTCMAYLGKILQKPHINKLNSNSWEKIFAKEAFIMLNSSKMHSKNLLDSNTVKLITFLEENINSTTLESNVEAYYYVLKIAATVRMKLNDFLKFYADDDDTIKRSIDSLDKLCTSSCRHLVNLIPTLCMKDGVSFVKLIEQTFSTDQILDDTPTRPSLRLTASMFNLAFMFLSPCASSYTTSYKYQNLFQNSFFKEIFSKLKNEYLLDVIIKDKAFKLLKNKIYGDKETIQPHSIEQENTNGSSESHAKVKKERGLQYLADVLFLLHFTTQEEVQITSSPLNHIIEILNELCVEELDDEACQHVVKDISQYYKSNQRIYLPLLFVEDIFF